MSDQSATERESRHYVEERGVRVYLSEEEDPISSVGNCRK
jgi:hypothetical protein